MRPSLQGLLGFSLDGSKLGNFLFYVNLQRLLGSFPREGLSGSSLRISLCVQLTTGLQLADFSAARLLAGIVFFSLQNSTVLVARIVRL